MESTTNATKNRWAVAVHVGAGYHSIENEPIYKKACIKACKIAKFLLSSGYAADIAVREAIRVLENNPLTNAGYGSNLTLEGEVECDASIMISSPSSDNQYSQVHEQFGGIGAASGIKNPIVVAHLIATQDKPGGILPGNRLVPTLLAGSGVSGFAKKIQPNFEDKVFEKLYPKSQIPQLAIDPSLMISYHSKQRFNYFTNNIKNSLDEGSLNSPFNLMFKDFTLENIANKCQDNETNLKIPPSENELLKDHLLDTVGAVCVDLNGKIASGVSSGGILLKLPGRVGEAGIFGAGCWAEHFEVTKKETDIVDFKNKGSTSLYGVGCSTTGAGEAINHAGFSKELAQDLFETNHTAELLKRSNDDDFLESNVPEITKTFKKFINNKKLKHRFAPQHMAVGSIALIYKENPDSIQTSESNTDASPPSIELFFAHTTASMGLGYFSDSMSKPKVFISRKDFPSQSFVSSGACL